MHKNCLPGSRAPCAQEGVKTSPKDQLKEFEFFLIPLKFSYSTIFPRIRHIWTPDSDSVSKIIQGYKSKPRFGYSSIKSKFLDPGGGPVIINF